MPPADYTCLAIDLGASSGRVIECRFDCGTIALNEIHRFVNEPQQHGDTLHWNFDGLFSEVKTGIAKSASAKPSSPASLAVDTWGVDFGLLDQSGHLLEPPVHYRDSRTHGVMEDVWREMATKEDIFQETGIQFLPFNTIYQLIALKRRKPQLLEKSKSFLMMADLFHYHLCGSGTGELTNSSTTQLFNPVKKDWSWKLIDALGLPSSIFPEVVEPGTTLAQLAPDVRHETGAGQLNVIAAATHDTGAAVAAVPAEESIFAYLSCGTWSLLGTETAHPVITDRALALNFTNEGGVEGTNRLLKNIMGLWLLQECRRHRNDHGHDYSWNDFTQMTSLGNRHLCIIDPDDSRFLPPGDMAQRVKEFCRDTGQPIPEEHKDIVACITTSLALKYRQVLEMLEELTGERIPVLHMVGGGIKNQLLCQWTANAIDRPVIAGPVEGTAIGNAGMQLIAAGRIASLAELRTVVRRSFELKKYLPEEANRWQHACERAKKVLS